MNVLITDGFSKEGVNFLLRRGYDVVNKKPDNLTKAIADYDALIVRSATKVIPEVIEAGAKGELKVIGRSGIGYDNIDVKAASKYGIPVMVAPHGNTNAAAELAIGLMFCLARNIPQAYSTLVSGEWRKNEYEGIELIGKTLGIIGCGRIGKRVASIAKHGLDMKVLGYDVKRFRDFTIESTDLEKLLQESDFVAIHTTGTSQIIDADALRLMKPNAYLINLSRGKSVDETALYEALKYNRIAGAALDVWQKEGKEGESWKSPLLELTNFIGLPHLGASTIEAQTETSQEMAEKIDSYLRSGQIEDGVNCDRELIAPYPAETASIIRVTHDDKPGMVKNMTDVISRYNVNLGALPYMKFQVEGETTGKALVQFFAETTDKNVLEQIKRELRKIGGVHRVTD